MNFRRLADLVDPVRTVVVLVLLSLPLTGVLSAEPADNLDGILGEEYTYIGSVQPRHAKDIAASNWSIGAETMDRDYTVYANWREFLGPLGAKKARIQSGWAKTEKSRGEYDWAWLDEIVFDMVEQGVEPWMCLCYGNPVYPGGGDTGLGGGLVASEEALQAWERYTTAVVKRYAKQIDEWEIWNEPRTGRGKGSVQYADFVIRTAEAIRKLQPDAQIFFAAGGSFDTTFATEVLDRLKSKGKLGLVNAVIYHPYSYNPDSSYTKALELRTLARSYAPHIDIKQGENGAPSKPGSFGAIAKYDWTEHAQAKWALRRLLGDLGHDIPSSYFAICDMRYPSRTNYKGLLSINDDKTVHHRKLGYFAVQHLTALFDDSLQRLTDCAANIAGTSESSKYSLFGYRTKNKTPLLTVWRSGDNPDKRPDMEQVTLVAPKMNFQNPVWIDLLSGRAYAIPATAVTVDDSGTTFKGLPVYDSPVVIANRTCVAAYLTARNEQTGEKPVGGIVLEKKVTINCSLDLSGVHLALEDLQRDIAKVLGEKPQLVKGNAAQIVIDLDASLQDPESYRVEITPDGIRIVGADQLGVIYGIYRFSREVLGVDPYWFFKNQEPQAREHIALKPAVLKSKKPTFRCRGWFVNDEDLLTEWKEGSGQRYIDYPFYGQVVNLDVIDSVFEALLRAGGNLVIPASFVDVMNEPEAALVKQAVRRGLYITQHHIEPLGVSHFGFENFWKAKGESYEFAYGSHPDRVRETWQAYAKRWYELAGDQIIWQMGLRGKADRAIWTSDKTVSRAEAGRLISQAIAEQWKIVRSVDRRPHPPATSTLWMEGSELMSEGSLRFPPEAIIVFADDGPTQKMQPDFYSTERVPERRYGVYYHIGFWGTGPHLLQGTNPQRVCQEFDQVVAKGDTDYAIINVCNVREHVLGVQVATELMCDRAGWSEAAFWERFAPPQLPALYQDFHSCLFPLSEERIIQDGALFAAARKILAKYAAGIADHKVISAESAKEREKQLTDAIPKLDAVIAAYPADELTASDREFHDFYLLTQAKMWRELFIFYRAVIQAGEKPESLAEAEAALQRLLEVRDAAAKEKWTNWYRGDKKVNVLRFLELTQAARKKLQSK